MTDKHTISDAVFKVTIQNLTSSTTEVVNAKYIVGGDGAFASVIFN